LKKLACGELNVKAGSLKDILRCVSVNFPKLGVKLKKLTHITDNILIVVDNEILDSKDIDSKIRDASVIELVPIIAFSGIFAAITAALIKAGLAVAAAKTIAFIATVVLVSAISFGISFLISKLLTPKDPKQVKTSSFILGAKGNVAARNTPIPLGYGKLRVGSYVVSSFGIEFDKSNKSPQAAVGGGAGGAGGYGAGGNIVVTRSQN
jgi:predicted phage tail protein